MSPSVIPPPAKLIPQRKTKHKEPACVLNTTQYKNSPDKIPPVCIRPHRRNSVNHTSHRSTKPHLPQIHHHHPTPTHPAQNPWHKYSTHSLLYRSRKCRGLSSLLQRPKSTPEPEVHRKKSTYSPKSAVYDFTLQDSESLHTPQTQAKFRLSIAAQPTQQTTQKQQVTSVKDIAITDIRCHQDISSRHPQAIKNPQKFPKSVLLQWIPGQAQSIRQTGRSAAVGRLIRISPRTR